MKKSERIRKKMVDNQAEIDFHRRELDKLEEKQFQLNLDLQNALFEEGPGKNIVSRAVSSIFDLRNHHD